MHAWILPLLGLMFLVVQLVTTYEDYRDRPRPKRKVKR